MKNKKQDLEKSIYSSVARGINTIFGQGKTAPLSTGLFLQLPIEIGFKKTKADSTKTDVEYLLDMGSYYVKQGDEPRVYMVFFYTDEKSIKKLIKTIHDNEAFITFAYMHELQHILRKHTTSAYDNMLMRIKGATRKLINSAQDYAINYSIKDLFDDAGLSKEIEPILKLALYNKEYHNKKMYDVAILEDLIKKGKQGSKNSLGNGYSKETFDGSSKVTPDDIQAGGSIQEVESISTQMSDLADTLQEQIKTATAGTKAGDLLNEIFDSIKVDTEWFSKVQKTFKRQVYYATNKYVSSWRGLNSTYRHIFKSPKRTFFSNKMEVIFAIDHSGSMSTDDLQKLLYIVESEAKHISKVTVLIHDTEIKKVFELENDFDITKSPKFKEALATRFSVGGTSHDKVFEYVSTEVKDISKCIMIVFSDMCSDIEETYPKYKKIHKIPTYWVNAGGTSPNVKGTHINV